VPSIVGAVSSASVGVVDLADEIASFVIDHAAAEPIDTSLPLEWKVCIESGTGTLALFLHQALVERHPLLPIKVIAIPCVGSSSFLMQQMKDLDEGSFQKMSFPYVLTTDIERTFAKPCQPHLDMWRSLQKECGVEFDLVYAPRAFEQLQQSFMREPLLWKNSHVLYLHCGGANGNESQLKRYKFTGMT
jgi:1-aminocyclopropane-1-carboxylate deaminase